MYRTIIAIFVFTNFIYSNAKSQQTLPEIYLNHVYFVLDSVSFAKLSDSNFVTQQLANLKVSSTTTTNGSWSGKYLMGKNSYFEFFAANGFSGASLGDCGLGFMTKKTKDINVLENKWQLNKKDMVIRDTSTRVDSGVTYPWFYSLSLMTSDSVQPLSTWVMENTPEHLRSVGFTNEEMSKQILWEEYAAKKNSLRSDKPFNYIRKAHILVNNKNFQYLKRSLTGFGLRQKQTTFSNNEIEITCTVSEKYTVRLQTVETELTGTFPETNVLLSDYLKVHVKGNKATWIFSY
ncbi:MAG: DUF5829 family protein [Chitinophagaceae bacterium]